MSRSIADVQTQAIAFVERQKANILRTAARINPRVSAQDLDDLVSEGYAIALELVAAGGLEHLKSVFWAKLHRSVWNSYDYLVDYVDFTDQENSIVLEVAAGDPLERLIEEERFLGSAFSVLDFLTAAERRVLCVLLGLTERGCCVEEEAAKFLGVSRSTVRVLLRRTLVKIEAASRRGINGGIQRRGKQKNRGAPASPRSPVFSPPFQMSV